MAVSGDGPEIGDRVEIDVNLPGHAKPVRVDAEVRWRRGSKLGLMFSRGVQATIAAFVAMVISTSASAAATSAVPEFDPNAETVLDMEGGGERPDDSQVLEAFQGQFENFDKCVERSKKGKDVQLAGDVDVQVLLDPKGKRPLGINATLPGKHDKDKNLRECLRSAIAAASYPSYNGPPVVVDFSFELDPGFVEVQEQDW